MAYGLLYDFLIGQCIDAYTYFGAHFEKRGKKEGVVFRLYAPNASDVSVIGEFNGWDVTRNKMDKVDDSGVFETFIEGVKEYQSYKFHFKNAYGQYVDKIDPYAYFSELRGGPSRTFDIRNFIWHDEEHMKSRDRSFDKPLSIYEMHVGSWLGKRDGRDISYEEVADSLIPYLQGLGYNCVEFMPVVQYPFDGSWGYQATGFYAVDSRYGNPKQLMSLIDRLHQAGIKVILDFAPVHFANDDYALFNYDGTHMYEYTNNFMTYSEWGSAQFDLGKDPVRSFLMSSMNFFATMFHVDGIRVDAVSNIIYYHGNKNNGTNEGAIEFVKRCNARLHDRHCSLMMIAEDSTDFQGVTKPTEYGGLGFDYKWDLGWMNDTLKYYSKDPIYRKYEHNKITFSMAYFYSENFMLPLSHDEVVHGKGTIINKMWGDYSVKFAFLRNLYTYQFAHPGKKLSFMGNELASFDEWNENKSLPWELKTFPIHDSVSRMIRDLNLIYRHEKAMYFEEYNPVHHQWLMVDNSNDSVFAFQRKVDDDVLIFVFNMTTNFYNEYNIGVEVEGTYQEIFNSDKDIYGGANQYNGLPITTLNEFGSENHPYTLRIKLASMGAMIFKLMKPEKKTKAKAKK